MQSSDPRSRKNINERIFASQADPDRAVDPTLQSDDIDASPRDSGGARGSSGISGPYGRSVQDRGNIGGTSGGRNAGIGRSGLGSGSSGGDGGGSQPEDPEDEGASNLAWVWSGQSAGRSGDQFDQEFNQYGGYGGGI